MKTAADNLTVKSLSSFRDAVEGMSRAADADATHRAMAAARAAWSAVLDRLFLTGNAELPDAQDLRQLLAAFRTTLGRTARSVEGAGEYAGRVKRYLALLDLCRDQGVGALRDAVLRAYRA